MALKMLPQALLAEILDYLADYEPLRGLDQILEGEYSIVDVKNSLRSFAKRIRLELESQKGQNSPMDYRKDLVLSPTVKDLLSALSPTDERRILEKFGFLDS